MKRKNRRLLIIDGFNVLRSSQRYQHFTSEDFADDWFNEAREALVNDVLSTLDPSTRAYIVFDGTGNPYSAGEETVVDRVTIVFSPAGMTADKIIEKLAFQAKSQGIPARVVSSDGRIQETIFGEGVVRMSAREFAREMADAFEDARLDDAPEIAHKNTVADRIDAKTLKALQALRDQGSQNR